MSEIETESACVLVKEREREKKEKSDLMCRQKMDESMWFDKTKIIRENN